METLEERHRNILRNTKKSKGRGREQPPGKSEVRADTQEGWRTSRAARGVRMGWGMMGNDRLCPSESASWASWFCNSSGKTNKLHGEGVREQTVTGWNGKRDYILVGNLNLLGQQNTKHIIPMDAHIAWWHFILISVYMCTYTSNQNVWFRLGTISPFI